MNATAERYDDDVAAVRRVLAGDVDAFEDLVRRWQGPLVNLAFRFARDHAVAEELAQEAFLKAYRGLAKFRQESRFSTWLFAVAMNHYRSAIRRRLPPTADLDDAARTLPGDDGDARQDAALRDEVIRRAVDTLPTRYREIVVLFYFHEMDLAETARTAKIPAGTVKARLFRARKLLHEKLESLMPDPAAAAEEA